MGNLPPGADCVIKLTYVELSLVGGAIVFRLPASVAPAAREAAETDLDAEDHRQRRRGRRRSAGGMSAQLRVRAACDVASVESTLPVRHKLSGGRALVEYRFGCCASPSRARMRRVARRHRRRAHPRPRRPRRLATGAADRAGGGASEALRRKSIFVVARCARAARRALAAAAPCRRLSGDRDDLQRRLVWLEFCSLFPEGGEAALVPLHAAVACAPRREASRLRCSSANAERDALARAVDDMVAR